MTPVVHGLPSIDETRHRRRADMAWMDRRVRQLIWAPAHRVSLAEGLSSLKQQMIASAM